MEKLIAISGWGFSSESIEDFRETLGYDGYSISSSELFSTSGPDKTLAQIVSEPVHLLTWSLGAMCILQYLIDNSPETTSRVRSLTLIGATFRFLKGEGLKRGMSRQIVSSMKARLEVEPEEVLKGFVSGVAPDSLRYLEKIEDVSQQVPKLIDGLAFLENFDIRSHLECLRLPVLVLHGGKDKVVPASNARAMAESISGARYHLVDSAGHMPFLSHQEECRKKVSEFIASCSIS